MYVESPMGVPVQRRDNGGGNTHVTCHVGVPSCGQRQRNVFIT